MENYNDYGKWGLKDFLSEALRMWRWIAEKTRERKTIITKEDYFEATRLKNPPYNGCYLCAYGHIWEDDRKTMCQNCPVDWLPKGDPCSHRDYSCEQYPSPYETWKAWFKAGNWKRAADAAEEVAKLIEKKLEQIRN